MSMERDRVIKGAVSKSKGNGILFGETKMGWVGRDSCSAAVVMTVVACHAKTPRRRRGQKRELRNIRLNEVLHVFLGLKWTRWPPRTRKIPPHNWLKNGYRAYQT